MSDNNDKIIDFYKRSAGIERTSKDKFFSSFTCVKLVKDDNGNYFSEEILREYSKDICYIVTIMKKNIPSVALYKYKVPQESLAEFLTELKKSAGELVDIDKYIPEDLA